MSFAVGYANRSFRIVGLILFVAIVALTISTLAISGDEFPLLELVLIPTWSLAFVTGFLFFGRVKSVHDRSGRIEVSGIFLGVFGLAASAVIYLLVLPSVFSFDPAKPADVLTVVTGSFVGLLLAYLLAPSILKTDQ